MHIRPTIFMPALLGLAAAMTAGPSQAQTERPARRRSSGPTPMVAYMTVDGQENQVTVVDRDRRELTFVPGARRAGTRQTVRISRIESMFFDLSDIDRGDLHRAIRNQNWVRAIRTLSPTIAPLLPYMDIPNNNAVDYGLDMGDYMMRAAARRLAGERVRDRDREIARQQYQAAYNTLRRVSRADGWSELGQVADLKSLQCLLILDETETARRLFANTLEPRPGNRTYGLYWLVKAEMEMEQDNVEAAMEAAVKSLCFENKDIDTFPDALLLSARAYESFEEWHRARDVYYEIARIFPDTDWSRIARKRLQFILDEDLTLEEEDPVGVETVFFGLEEDMNKHVAALLAEPDERRRARAPREDEEDEEEDRREDEDADLRVFE